MAPEDINNNKQHGNICTIDQLNRYLKLTLKEKKLLEQVIDIHPLLISKYYLSLINKKDPQDPIRKMIIPSKEELVAVGSYDTSGEHENTKMPGLQHKYKQTAFIISTNRCAAYCRFCFRKRLVGLSTDEVLSRFDTAVKYIKKHKEINNVLISGGDAFMLPTSVIEKFLKKLLPIKHLDFIRFATRTPVTYPQRIIGDKRLLRLLKRYSTKERRIYIVTHFNHPREITPRSRLAINLLLKSNTQIFNQTVLLRGVNDKPKVLVELFSKLIKMDILPYYLFQCRPVNRVKDHFAVPIYHGLKIYEQARRDIRGHIICKRLKYIMAHPLGKVEIVGIIGNKIYFKFHHAKKHKDAGKLFNRKLNKWGVWLDDFRKA